MKRVLGLFFCVMLLVACSSGDTNPVKLYELVDFGEIKKDTLILYTKEKDVAIFQQAVDSAVQIPGIADVFSPMYLFELNGKSYYLWLYEAGGSLINLADTHTIYSLTEDSATVLKELLQ